MAADMIDNAALRAVSLVALCSLEEYEPLDPMITCLFRAAVIMRAKGFPDMVQ